MRKDDLNDLGKFTPKIVSTTKITPTDRSLLQELEKQNKISMDDNKVLEFLKCRANPFYFIHKYVKLQEVGGETLYSPDKMNNKTRRLVKSLYSDHRAIFLASRQLGKCECINTPIPLPDGAWTTMGALDVGSIVLDNDGHPTKVTAVTEVMHDLPSYEIEFDCGEKITACEDHLWKIHYKISGKIKEKEKIVTTKELIDIRKKLRNRLHIKVTKPIRNTKKKLPIDPYVLGVWLGDVTNYSGVITTLKANNLYKNKHVPRIYFSGSVYQRLQLVRGLMDTYGSCNKKGQCKFSQSNYQLIKDFQELLTSLGIKAAITEYNRKNYGIEYTIYFSTKKFYVFNFKRKRERQRLCFNHPKNYRHYIKKITKVDSVPMRCITVDNKDKMYLCGKHFIPTHNSTIAAAIIAHSLIYFPGSKAIIVNMNMDAGLENINKIKFILEQLPKWMNFLPPRMAQRKTYIELMNDSKATVIYPSTIKSPSTLGRSFTVPLLYIDECAFISHIDEIYGAAQPTISTAREQAMRHRYPYWLMFTSTPNGSEGDGKFFHDYWMNAIDSDVLYEPTEDQLFEKRVDDYSLLVDDPNKNGFIRVKYHWSEDSRKDENWYKEQCKELNFDERKIGQELDLTFVGAQNCIFTDAQLMDLQTGIQKPIETKLMPHQTFLKIYKEVDETDYYIIGVDTASSITGAFNAIEIFSFRDFEQVAEMSVRLGSLTKYGEVIDAVAKYYSYETNGRFILVIENNSIGRAPIEYLLNHVTDFNYISHLYSDKPGKDFGLHTNKTSKDLMVASLYEYISENPKLFHSEEFVTQLHGIGRTNSGLLTHTKYSDLFMAACFCALIRKTKALEIGPYVIKSDEKMDEELYESIKSLAQLSSPKSFIKSNKTFGVDSYMDIGLDDYENIVGYDDDDESSAIFPFLN